MAVWGLLTALVMIWFGVHVGFPRGSQPSRLAGVFLALSFFQLLLYSAIQGNG